MIGTERIKVQRGDSKGADQTAKATPRSQHRLPLTVAKKYSNTVTLEMSIKEEEKGLPSRQTH